MALDENNSIQLFDCATEQHEAEAVMNLIRRLTDRAGTSYTQCSIHTLSTNLSNSIMEEPSQSTMRFKDIAILYRCHRVGEELRRMLSPQLPVIVYGKSIPLDTHDITLSFALCFVPCTLTLRGQIALFCTLTRKNCVYHSSRTGPKQ